jgi:hypothetical protein
MHQDIHTLTYTNLDKTPHTVAALQKIMRYSTATLQLCTAVQSLPRARRALCVFDEARREFFFRKPFCSHGLILNKLQKLQKKKRSISQKQPLTTIENVTKRP